MKKMILLASVAAMFALSGCATVSTTKVDKMNDIEHKEQTEIHAFGGLKAVVLGPVFFKQDGPCSEVDFVKFVSSKKPEAKDIYRVRMEYHQEKNGMVEKQYCKYSGLALDYVAISPEETAKWASTYGYSVNQDALKAENAPKLVPDGIIMKPAAAPEQAAPQYGSEQTTDGLQGNAYYSRQCKVSSEQSLLKVPLKWGTLLNKNILGNTR